MPEASLRGWLYKPTAEAMSWKQERDVMDSHMDAALAKGLFKNMSQIVQRMVNVALRSVSEADIEGLRLTKPREFKEWVDALVKFRS